MQSALVLISVVVLFVCMLINPLFNVSEILNSTESIQSPGWVLLLVAFLQVWSYPMHDPVMMDRGFLADREVTRRSFLHAAWISIACILMFALLGVFAGIHKVVDESMLDSLTRLFGEPVMAVFSVTLIISALSTLDSTFSSASKLVVKDMRLLPETVASGRIVMIGFLIVGGLFLLWDSDDLYAAVAVSGTLSMVLLPVIVFCVWGNRDVHLWPLSQLLGYEHKYTKLLAICIVIAIVGLVSFSLGLKERKDSESAISA